MRSIEPIDGIDQLPEGVQTHIAGLEIRLDDLERESWFWRCGALVAFVLFVERLWGWY